MIYFVVVVHFCVYMYTCMINILQLATYGMTSVCRRKWRLCSCGETQTMSHIVESCPVTKLNGSLSWLYSVAEDAVLWLTNYGSWHTYEENKKKSVLHAAARLIYSKRKYEHTTPLLVELHCTGCLHLSAFSQTCMVLLRHTLLTSCSWWKPWSHTEGYDPWPRPDWMSPEHDGLP